MTVWKSVHSNLLYGIAKSSFVQDGKPNRLELDVGDALVIEKECDLWYYGYKKDRRNVKGIFPKVFVHILPSVYDKNELIIDRSEIVSEITTVIREWGHIFKHYFLINHEYLPILRKMMLKLISLRAKLILSNIPADEIKELQTEATDEIDAGNKRLDLDMVVRDDTGNILDINKTSTAYLFQQYKKAEERVEKSSQRSFRLGRDKTAFNILLTIYDFHYHEDVDLMFNLRRGIEQKAITENYIIELKRKESTSHDLIQLNKHVVTLTDLSIHDFLKDNIYLVCTSTTVKTRGSSQIKQAFGVGAFNISDLLKNFTDSVKQSIDLPFLLCNNRDNLDDTFKKLLTNRDTKYDLKIPMIIETFYDKNDYRNSRNTAYVKKIQLSEVILPNDVRNDLYITLISGEFTKGNKTSERNVEVSATLCNFNGDVLSNVISVGVGVEMQNEYKSVVYHHEGKPKWNETFKIIVPIEDFKNCHIQFLYKHHSTKDPKEKHEKPFAMSFVKLMQDDGTTLKNNDHRLVIYKIDPKKYDKQNQIKCSYLKLPSLFSELKKEVKITVQGLSILPKDFLVIETNLCSTKLTQDIDLFNLLNWCSKTSIPLQKTLENFLDVSDKEIVKFLPDILDVLFNIMVDENDTPNKNQLVLKCLLKLIEIVSNLKYQHFQLVLDLYINKKFSSTLAYPKLLSILNNEIIALLHTWEDESYKLLDKAIKHIEYIMKFIIRSRNLFLKNIQNLEIFYDNPTEITSFSRYLEELLGSLRKLMVHKSNDYLIVVQRRVLHVLHVFVSNLAEVYDPMKITQFAVDIITNISDHLVKFEMNAMKHFISSKIFKIINCREVLLPLICNKVKVKLESKVNLQVLECVQILNSLLNALFGQDMGDVDGDINQIVLILLRAVIQTSTTMRSDHELISNLIATLLGILRVMKKNHYDIYVAHLAKSNDLLDFLTEILLLLQDLVQNPVFPINWMDMIMHQNTVVVGCLKHLADILNDKFLNDKFCKQIWMNHFNCSIALLTQPGLQINRFSINKQSTILARYGDLRFEGVKVICRMWFDLGPHKIKFLPELVELILIISFIPDNEIRRCTIPIFFDMMQCEHNMTQTSPDRNRNIYPNKSDSNNSFKEFEREFIEKLDKLVTRGDGDEDYKNLFNKIMIERCVAQKPRIEGSVTFIEMVTTLLTKLLEYRLILNGEGEDNRMACIVNLLGIYEEMGRDEMYIRYINILFKLHKVSENYTEAAFTLKLYDKFLNWSDDPLPSGLKCDDYPDCQTHRELKELIYSDIIKYFSCSQTWEYAFEVCKELVDQYEYLRSDKFKQFSKKDLLDIYDKILVPSKKHRFFFRVGYFGLKFSNFLRNKVFVYQTSMPLDNFIKHISNQHPMAEVMFTQPAPGPEITESDAKYIQIVTVEPVITANSKFFNSNTSMPQIMKYYERNNFECFKYSRPIVMEGVKDKTDVRNLWKEDTTITISNPLPGILKWFPVVSTVIEQMSPIECAIETIELKNNEIAILINEHRIMPDTPVNQLVAKIKGVIIPEVNGGIKMYEDAFLSEEFIQNNPQLDEHVQRLKGAINDLMPLLESALSIVRSKSKKESMQLVEVMGEEFVKLKVKIEERYGKKQCLDIRAQDEAGNILDINKVSTTYLFEQYQKIDKEANVIAYNSENRCSLTELNNHCCTILLNVTNVVFKTKANIDLIFTLYDGTEQRPITENYIVKWERHDIANNFIQLTKHFAMFTELNSQYFKTDNIYLVCYGIQTNDEVYNNNFRRPFGVGIYFISDLINNPKQLLRNNMDIPFWLCSEQDNLDATVKKLLGNKDIKYESKIAVSIEIFHGDLKYIKEEYPHIHMLENISYVKKLGFPEIILSDDDRNDLYITLLSGEFSKITQPNDRNIEITVTVHKSNGDLLPNVISVGVGVEMQSDYKSVVYYNEDKPKWNETFKINAPIQDFTKCYVQFLYKYRSTKNLKEQPFAISFMKLMQDDGTAIKNGDHRLLVYKIDHKRYNKENQSQCFDNLQTKSTVHGLSVLPKDYLSVQTNLCSTKLSQDVYLLNFFNWSPGSQFSLDDTLQSLLRVREEEIFIFLSDILDILFNIMVDENDIPTNKQLVFKCFVNLIEHISILKHQHWESILDLYINKKFSSTLAFSFLLSAISTEIRKVVQNPWMGGSDKIPYKAIKHVQYIMRFITRSRELYLKTVYSYNLFYDKPMQESLSFERNLEELLDCFRELMAYKAKQLLIDEQSALLRVLHVIVSDLAEVYDPVMLTKFAVDILSNNPQLVQFNMDILKKLIRSTIFKISKCRELLLPILCYQIKIKWESIEGILECVSILNDLLEILFRQDIGDVDGDINQIMLILLRTVIQTSNAMRSDHDLISHLIKLLLGILRVMKKIHYDIYVAQLAKSNELLDFLTEILLLFQDLVQNPVFPINWMDMIMHQNTVIVGCLKHLADILNDKFLNDKFCKQIWMNHFNCSIALLTQLVLQLNRFSINKQSTILARYDDIRFEGVKVICRMWFDLGPHKIKFLPELVESILIISFIPDNEIRRCTIPIFFDMMQCEHNMTQTSPDRDRNIYLHKTDCNNSFKEFEREFIEKLDKLVTRGDGDEDYKNLFNKIMIERCVAQKPRIEGSVTFIEMVTTLLTKLLEYRLTLNEEGEDNRMTCIVNLLGIYEEMGRDEMYIRYINILFKLHKTSENYTEAAFTLKLYDKFLNWSDDPLPSGLKSNDFPDCQTHRELKELIYNDIINYFNLGQAWECALEICKQLVDQYENVTFDYVKLSAMYNILHTYYGNILTSIRIYPNYFRVGFFGQKFPDFFRNKVFVYRSKPLERLGDFKDRISNQHPMAEIMLTQAAPGPEITESDAKYIQITFVEPVITENSQFFDTKITSPQIIKYYEKNNVECFKYSRRMIVEGSQDKNDIRNLWKECTTITISNPLPGILKWFPVVDTSIKQTSPIECAIETIELRNNEITNLINEHRVNTETSVNQLAGNIKEIILPEVNGGVQIYEDAFLADEFLQNNPQFANAVGRLKRAIVSQIPLLEIALTIVKTKKDNEFTQLVEAMDLEFVQLKTKLEALYTQK